MTIIKSGTWINFVGVKLPKKTVEEFRFFMTEDNVVTTLSFNEISLILKIADDLNYNQSVRLSKIAAKKYDELEGLLDLVRPC